MPNHTGINHEQNLRRHLSLANPAIWFGLGLCFVILAPIVPIAPWLPTFMHPWRPELAASLFLLGFLIWGYRIANFRTYLSGISKQELFAIILPCAAFAAWSFLSVFYAASWKSAMHHSLVWSAYLVFFLLLRYFLGRSAETRVLIVAAVAAMWMIAIPAVVEYYTSVNTGEPTTIGIRYSKYAEMLNTLFPVILAFTLRLKGRAFWLGAVTVILTWLFAISSLSRAAVGLYILGTAAIAIAIFALRRFHHYRARFSLIVLLLIVVPLLLHAPAFMGSKGVPLVDRMQNQAISESTNVRPFFSRIALEMFKDRPFTGIGADNFGVEFNKYRERYAAGHAGDPNLSIAEADIPERAHNEYSQIAAELGVPGIILFGWFMAGIAWLFFKALKRRFRIPLPVFGALIGMVLFLASSFVTSYSFRILQNGFVFFLALGIAAKSLLSPETGVEAKTSTGIGRGLASVGFSAAILCCCLLAVLSILRVIGGWYGYKVASAASMGDASSSVNRSIAFDDQNAHVSSVYALYLFESGKFADAAPQFRRTIDLGRATTVDYSYLASAQALAGDLAGAEASLAEAVRIYPVSVFIRARYASVLKEAGRSGESDEQFKIALKIDQSQAETWRNLIEEGAVAASRKSFESKLPPVMDLKPTKGIYAVLAEREVRHPEEKSNFPF